MPDLATMDTPALGARLAVIQAVYKLAAEELSLLKAEMKIRLLNGVSRGITDSIPLTIGGQKVGRYYATKATAAVCDEEEFGRWAYERGEGWKEIKILIEPGQMTDDEDAELLRALEDMGLLAEETHVARNDLRKELKVVNDRVVDDNGELVPGTYVKAPQTRITRLAPQDVADAMRLAGDQLTVSGLLDGE